MKEVLKSIEKDHYGYEGIVLTITTIFLSWWWLLLWLVLFLGKEIGYEYMVSKYIQKEGKKIAMVKWYDVIYYIVAIAEVIFFLNLLPIA